MWTGDTDLLSHLVVMNELMLGPDPHKLLCYEANSLDHMIHSKSVKENEKLQLVAPNGTSCLLL